MSDVIGQAVQTPAMRGMTASQAGRIEQAIESYQEALARVAVLAGELEENGESELARDARYVARRMLVTIWAIRRWPDRRRSHVHVWPATTFGEVTRFIVDAPRGRPSAADSGHHPRQYRGPAPTLTVNVTRCMNVRIVSAPKKRRRRS